MALLVPAALRRSAVALAVLLAVALGVAGCGAPAPRPSVVLISIDTLRADHLGCYGYHRPTSPAIDRLAGEGLRFENAFAAAPSTLPSHATMFSSLLPQHHGASMAKNLPLPESVETLAETLQAAGYRTGAFVGGGQMDATFGLDQGFEVYDGPLEDLTGAAEAGLRWLDGVGSEPFLLFLHTYEVHHPYDPDEEELRAFAPDYDGALPAAIEVDLLRRINRGEVEIGPSDLDWIMSAYDAEILAMDRSLGRLLEALRERGLYETSLIVVASDHGEEFGEHGKVGWHSHTLYDELLRVPWIMKLPEGRSAGTSIAAPARLIDLAPTITAALGLATPSAFAGEDLLGERAAGARPVVAKIDHQLTFEALRLRDWKWNAGRLFDLSRDPQELDDLATVEPELASQLKAELAGLVAAREEISSEPVAPDEDVLERLKALGYID